MTWFIRLFFPGFAVTPPEETCAPSSQDLPTVPPEPALSEIEIEQRSTIRTLLERAPTASKFKVDDDGDVTLTWEPVPGDDTYRSVTLWLWRINVRVTVSTLAGSHQISVPMTELPDADAVRLALFEKSRREICAAALKATEPR